MPISKTCYFCDLYPSGMIECDGNRFTKECFTPNADWLYIEQLEKENEELKKYKEETEKWLGSSPYIYVDEDEVKE
jgi:hypothetical protein